LKANALGYTFCFSAAPQNMNVIWVFELEAKDDQNCLEAILCSLDVVSQKQVIFRRSALAFKFHDLE